jgi:hypothetical protein
MTGHEELKDGHVSQKMGAILILICSTMSADDDDDDYLSEKFIVNTSAASSQPLSYSQLRKEAKKKAQIKNEENRRKSRRQLELEAREEGLSKSLFERAKEEEASGSGTTNKALSIMMKMGFKPGQSLGNTADQDEASSSPPINVASSASNEQKLISSPLTGALDAVSTSDAHITVSRETRTKHKTEPLPLQEWEGQSRPSSSILGDAHRGCFAATDFRIFYL